MSTLTTRAFWNGALERGIKAMAATAIPVLTAGPVTGSVEGLDAIAAVLMIASAGLVSVLTSVVQADFTAATNVAAVVDKNGAMVAGPALDTPDGYPVEVVEPRHSYDE